MASKNTIEEQPISRSNRVRSFFNPGRSIADLRAPMFWKDVVIETIECAYIGCILIFIIVTCNTHHYEPNTTHFGLFAGFLIFAILEGWFPLCEGLINPAASFAFFLVGRISLARAIICSLAETAGVAIGASVGYSLTPEEIQKNSTYMHAVKPAPGLSDAQAMTIEAIVTFNLIMVALSTTNPKKLSTVATLAIGTAKGSGILVAGTHTGGLQNPIVPFAPALVSKDFEHHWVVYWIGPYIGATVAALLYKAAIAMAEKYSRHDVPTDDANCCCLRLCVPEKPGSKTDGNQSEMVRMKTDGE